MMCDVGFVHKLRFSMQERFINARNVDDASLRFLAYFLLVNVTIMNVNKQNQWNVLLTFNTLGSFWDEETYWNLFPPLKIACAVYADDDDDVNDIQN